MPDSRRHRGPHPSDAMLFGRDDSVQTLRMAAGDFAWLLGRHYAQQAALTLVGNRYQLHRRQRLALSRAVAAPHLASRVCVVVIKLTHALCVACYYRLMP